MDGLVAAAPVDGAPAVSGVPFYKMTGSGNDFVILDGRVSSPDQWPEPRVKAVCDRRNGVGADGLVVLAPSASDSVRMIYWNADGSRSAMCGNAALCCGRLAVRLGFVSEGEFCLLTDAGPVRVTSSKSGAVEINLPDFQLPSPFRAVAPDSGERWIALVTVGVPHLVVRVDDIEAVEPAVRGRWLRHHPALGPAGANVNFVAHGAAPTDPWLIRTYERGVEDETLACGTGTVAAAAALAARHEASLPVTFRSRGGPQLGVRGQVKSAAFSDAWLAGEGRLLFRGVWGEEGEALSAVATHPNPT